MLIMSYFNCLIKSETSHAIGGTIGFTTGVYLTVTSVFSRTLRCTMLLVIPRYVINL